MRVFEVHQLTELQMNILRDTLENPKVDANSEEELTAADDLNEVLNAKIHGQKQTIYVVYEDTSA